MNKRINPELPAHIVSVHSGDTDQRLSRGIRELPKLPLGVEVIDAVPTPMTAGPPPIDPDNIPELLKRRRI